MNKKLILMYSLLLISILLLSSCAPLGFGIVMNDDKKADARVEQVVEVIQKQDKTALKAMFSKQALDEAKDLDGGMDYIFELFQGDVKSTEYDSRITDESTDYGDIVKEVKSVYNVETDKQKYLLFLLEYTQDTDHPDNVGLYTLRIIKAEDKKTQFTYWQYMKIAGIYIPEK